MTTAFNPPKFNPHPSNESELILVVGQWAKHNFGQKRASHLGIVEEIGEATHCVLKSFQGIRGFDNEDFFKKEFGDALADTMIYLADWCSERNSFFNFGRNLHLPPKFGMEEQNRIITHLLQAASRITQMADHIPTSDSFRIVDASESNMVAQNLCTGLEMWALVYDMDLRLLVADTWAKVSQRDWTKGQTEQPAHLS